MLVVDAGTGQNAINQVEMFDEAVGLTGLTITVNSMALRKAVYYLILPVVRMFQFASLVLVRKLTTYVLSLQNPLLLLCSKQRNKTQQYCF